MTNRMAIFLLFACLSLSAQSTASNPISIPSPKSNSEIVVETPPTLLLHPLSPQARPGKVWIRKMEAGLVIIGRVDGPKPVFPTKEADLQNGEHVELWLSAVRKLELPPIGWGYQFDDITLPNGAASCSDLQMMGSPAQEDTKENCRKWAQQQEVYRKYFKRLFVRQWQMAPGLVRETYAEPAFAEIERRFDAPIKNEWEKNPPEILQPRISPFFREFRDDDAGYQFQITVPWDALPPTDDQRLQDLDLLVEVFSGPGRDRKFVYSSTAPSRAYGEPETFNHVRIEQPREYELTPCDYELTGLDIHREPQKAYFLPTQSDMLTSVFILQNYTRGYAYGPTGLSPGTRETKFFWKESGDEVVCGPLLRYKKANTVSPTLIEKVRDYDFEVVVSSDKFDFRHIDGDLIVKQGPAEFYSEYGSGQCGACPRVGTTFWRVNADNTATKILDDVAVIDGEDDIDVQVSPDWKRVGIYHYLRQWSGNELTDPAWHSQMMCFEEHTYKKCGPESNTPPPEPRTLRYGEERE
jgi:hypothetical protein